MNTKDIFIGKIIREKVEKSGMTYTEFARRINSSRTSLYTLFESKSIDVEKLISISEVLDCDLFLEVYGIGSNRINDLPFLAIPINKGKLDLRHLDEEQLMQIKDYLYNNNISLNY